MASQSDGVVDDATKTATEQVSEEQTKPAEQSLEFQLLELAKEEGLIHPDAVKPGEPVTPEEEETAPEDPETVVEPTDETTEEAEEEPKDEEPAKPKGDAWPDSAKARVAEETEKRKRANDRADRVEAELQKAQALVAQLQSQAAGNVGPMPTPDNPVADIQDGRELDKIERVLEAIIEVDVDNVNDDGTVTLPCDIKNGKWVYQNVPAKDAVLAQKRADRTVRKAIPERRDYLIQRAQKDAAALEIYPELSKPDTDFAKNAAYLAHQILSGNAQKDPELLVWIGHAIYGLQKRTEELRGSNGKPVEQPVKELVRSARTPIAPTATRTRSLVTQKTVADRRQKEKAFIEKPTEENAVDYVGTILGQGGKKAIAPIT